VDTALREFDEETGGLLHVDIELAGYSDRIKW